ncbi:hypothetical protein BDY19DRAFT_499937 [Irpex rosettiformis]|uniref:Uncharacterized protein n=1 Tax=Irpex rosettiformis TaxID=378272 RepID=A0ACB8UEB9_9APHY|nr:hypothetical protein BDY19DRAFT_499937 [Irpex rosettiformis]
MPTAVTSNGAPSTTVPKRPHQRSKKSRTIRRRGRIHSGSDDEIEREARSDSDSDSDDRSSLDSETDSETASDDEHHAGIVTPSTTQSPPPLEINGQSSSFKADPIVAGGSGPFVSTTDWAQIVADENAAGVDDLPVIDFADMRAQVIPEPVHPAPRSKKAQKQAKKAAKTRPAEEQPPAQLAPEVGEEPSHEDDSEPVASTSHTAKESSQPRSRGQSVRQAYQERLQQDPAFVPRVGEFWGHDDRLLDKDLRSLSGWWRGRWHNRGRGRGAFATRGRGGRGFFPGRVLPQEGQEQVEETEAAPHEGVPPIERAWTHDGFEEMKRREEHRRSQAQAQTPASQRGAVPRGRGGVVPRGRGGTTRGGRPASPPTLNGTNLNDPLMKRTWFAMKPEKIWTKHAESFLYTDTFLRPRHGQTGNVRVKLPGRAARVLPAQQPTNHPESSRSTPDPVASSSTTVSTEDSERQFVVLLPRKASQQAEPTQPTATAASAQPATTTATDVELSIEEVFTVRPHAVPSHVPIDVPNSEPSQSQPVTGESAAVPLPDVSGLPEPSIQRQLEQLGMGIGSTTESAAPPNVILEETLLRHPHQEDSIGFAPQPSADQPPSEPPSLHPLQTSFSPVPPTPPPYGSPYAFGPSLPHGIMMSPQGYPYEISTGRPVYLQHAPTPLYTPRPSVPYMGHPPPGIPFVPGHMSHPSQEFVPHPHTPVNGFIDPATGVPIFSPARQNSRIEIRAPTDRFDGTAVKSPPRPSNLRTSVTEGDPAAAEDVTHEASGAPQAPLEGQLIHSPPGQPPMVAYAPYPAQYYYPDPNAYTAYMDMTPQMHYELYPPHDQRAHQPIIYY